MRKQQVVYCREWSNPLRPFARNRRSNIRVARQRSPKSIESDRFGISENSLPGTLCEFCAVDTWGNTWGNTCGNTWGGQMSPSSVSISAGRRLYIRVDRIQDCLYTNPYRHASPVRRRPSPAFSWCLPPVAPSVLFHFVSHSSFISLLLFHSFGLLPVVGCGYCCARFMFVLHCATRFCPEEFRKFEPFWGCEPVRGRASVDHVPGIRREIRRNPNGGPAARVPKTAQEFGSDFQELQ